MRTEWNVVAESMFDQLSNIDRSMVISVVERAAMDWQDVGAKRLVGVKGQENVFVLRAGAKFRVVLARHPEKIIVLDVVPYGQIVGLRGPHRENAG
jgi:hypothetical protein